MKIEDVLIKIMLITYAGTLSLHPAKGLILPTVARTLCHFVTSPYTVGSHPLETLLKLFEMPKGISNNFG